MIQFYVYQLRLSTSALPFYVGKGCGKRMFQHLVPSSYGRPGRKNRIIEKAIRQGVEVIPEILHDNLTEDEAMELEKLYISVLGRTDIGTGILANHTDGGEGRSGYKPSPETRVKMGSANRGKKMSSEKKRKISASLKGNIIPQEARAKISIANRGKTRTPETRKRISESQKGKTRKEGVRKNSMYGQWNRNPEWLAADIIYTEWLQHGMPGLVKLRRLTGRLVPDGLVNRLKSGWNPAYDRDWVEYRDSFVH